MKEKFKNILNKINKIKNTKYSIYIFIVLFLSIIASIIYFSYAYYNNDDKGLVLKGTVSLKRPDLHLIIYKQDLNSSGQPINNSYSLSDTIPSGHYIYNETKTECTNGASIDQVGSNITMMISSKKSVCSVYYDYSPIVIVRGNGKEAGSEICFEDDCFYVVSSTSTTVSMLAKYNLNSSSRQASNSTLTSQFASSRYWGSTSTCSWCAKPSGGTYVFVYGNSSNNSIYSYVNNYVTYLNNTYNIGATGSLLSYEQAVSLGCAYGSSNTDRICDNAPAWVHDRSYWLGSSYNTSTTGTNSNIWFVKSGTSTPTFSYGSGTSSYTKYGIRPLITLNVNKIPTVESNLEPNLAKYTLASGTGQNVGDKICTGTDCFYVISNDGTDIQMLAEYNLLVGNEWYTYSEPYSYACTTTEQYCCDWHHYDKSRCDGYCTREVSTTCTSYSTGYATRNISTSTSGYGKQSSSALGGSKNVYQSGTGFLAYSTSRYWSSGYSKPAGGSYIYVYDNKSSLYTYVNSYVNTINSTYKLGATGKLLAYEQYDSLKNLTWFKKTSFWFGSANSNSSDNMWTYDRAGSVQTAKYNSNNYYGVRPLLTIPSNTLG